MINVLIFVGAIVVALILGFGLDTIEKFIPGRVFDTALIILVFFWLRWALKGVIKEAISEALKESKA